MDDLHLAGLTEDGEHLVLSSAHGEQFRLPLDDRLLAAIRGDLVRLGQLQIELESQLRPAEIQSRIRAGASAEEVAMAAGIPVAKVRRYEGPVLAERDHVAGQARRTPARRRGDGFVPLLGDLVERRVGERGMAVDMLRWDASRRDDGTWTVTASMPGTGGGALRATWGFDARRGLLSPLDDEALRLSGEESERPPAPERRTTAGGGRRLSSVPRPALLGRPGVAELPIEPAGALRDEPAAEPGAEDVPELDDLGDGNAEDLPASLPRDSSGIQPALEEPSPGEPGAEDPAGAPAPRPAARRRTRRRLEGGPSSSTLPDPAVGTGSPVTGPAGTDPTGADPTGVDPTGADPRDCDPADDQAGSPGADRRAPARHSAKGRRATVPAWDDIVFGVRRKD